jgi:hypothetical protein
MNRKLRTLSLGILAIFAISAMAAMSASGEVGGHFTFEETNTALKATEDPNHPNRLHTTGVELTCQNLSYSGLAMAGAGKTLTSVTVAGNFESCYYEKEAKQFAVEVKTNGCEFKFTVRQKDLATKHSTVHILCATNLDKDLHMYAAKNERRNMIEIEAEGLCNITIPEQTPTKGGIIYKTGGAAGKTHDVDVTATVEGIHSTKHGLCNMFDPTNKTFTEGIYTGQVTVKGFNGKDEQVGITATEN